MIFTPTRVYKDVAKNIKRVNLLRGGTRSTKSFSITQMAVRWLMYGKLGDMDIPNGDWFILRESFPALRRTVLKDFHMILAREGFLPFVDHRKTTNEFERQDRRVSFFSADDDSKIHGPQNTIFWINEATAVKYNTFFQLFIRCSHVSFCDYNPIDPNTWVRQMELGELDVPSEDITLDISTVHDNPYLPGPQMKAILGIKDTELRDVYLKGNWTKLTGLVFPNFKIIDKLPETYKKRYFAVDFGWVHPFVLLEIRQTDDDVYIHEHVMESEFDYQELKTREIVAELQGCRGVADSADPRSINSLRAMGLRVKAVKKPKIVESVRKVRSHNLFITRASEATIKQFKLYKRQKDANDKYIEEPLKQNDDSPDALRYGITHFSRKSLIKLL